MAITFHVASGSAGVGTCAHTVPAGILHSMLVVGVGICHTLGTCIVTGMTYNGQACSLRRRSAYSAGAFRESTEVWYLLNPPSGVANVVLTVNVAPNGIMINALTFSGVDQGTPFSSDAEAVGTSAVSPVTTTVVVVSQTGELAIDFTSANNNNNSHPAGTVGAGQTSLYENEGVQYEALETSSEPGTTSNTFTWSLTTIGELRWAAVALSIRPYIDTSARAIKYILDVSDGEITLRDDQGSIVDPWDVEPDEWMNVNIPDLPTAVETDSFVDDAKKVYIEETEYDDTTGNLSIRNNRGQLLNVIMARLSGGGTI